MKTGLKIVSSLLVLALGIALAWWLVQNRPTPRKSSARPPIPLVRTVEVKPQSHVVMVYSQGTVRPRTNTNIVPEVSGRVVWVSSAWAEGGFFEKDEILLKIDSIDYELALTVAEAEVAQTELRLTQEEQEAAVARREWESLGQKDQKGQKAPEPPPLVLREPQLKQARMALEAAKARKKRAAVDLQRTDARAPFAGRLWEKQVDIGQFVTRGSPVARVYAVDYAEVRLPIPDRELAFLDLPLHYRGEAEGSRGPRVRLRADFAGAEQVWRGHLVRTEGEIDPKSRMVHVVARVDNPYGRGEDPTRPPLAVGMFVEAEIVGREFEDVFVLPRHTLRGGNQLLVVDEGSSLRFREIEVLRSHGETALVRRVVSGVAPGRDLLPGDRVCLSLLDVVVEGTPVHVAAEELDRVTEEGSP